MTLMSALRQRLSGLALPGYVIDIPGGFGKVPVNNNYVTIQDDGTYLIKDYDGNIHHYDDRR
jgi:lysine 2,3-aminomutase